MRFYRFIHALSISAAICLGMKSPAFAQELHPLKGPGLGNLSYNQSELFRPISRIGWNPRTGDLNGIPVTNHTVLRRVNGQLPPGANGTRQKPYGTNVGIMLNGYFVTAFAPDSGEATGGFLVYDVSDPRNIRLVKTVFDPEGQTAEFREPHAFGVSEINGKTYLSMPTTTGVEFWDFTDVNNIHRASRLPLQGISGGDYTNANWQMWWQAPYLYVAAANRGLYIVDASDPTNPSLATRPNGGSNPVPTTALGGFNIGPIFTMGNTMVLSGMETRSGFSVLDISNPVNPVPIAVQSQLPQYYATCYNGKKLYTSGRLGAGTGNIAGYDLINRERIVLENMAIPSDEGLYCATQDDYMIIGAQRKIIKYDITNPAQYVQVGVSETVPNHSNVPPRGNLDPDLGQVAMFGNLVFIGSDHGTDTAFMPHQLAPDTTPPSVLNVSPENGAVQQAVTSRIGIALSDSILPDTLSLESFKVRNRTTGELVDGRYSVQLGIINFSPSRPLALNTEYEVVLEPGGVKDYAGNPIAERFVSTFTTGSSQASETTLRHHWPLTADLRDERGALHGIPTTADRFTEGAFDTRGRATGVRLPSDSLAYILGNTSTVSFKIKTTMVGTSNSWSAPGIFGRDQPGGTSDIFWGWIDNGGHINLTVGNDFRARSPNRINDGNWHEVVMSRNATNGRLTLSVDGATVTANGAEGVVGVGERLQMLGEIQDTSRPFVGFLQDVKIHDGLLSPTQIRRLFLNETVKLQPNTFGQPATFDPNRLYLNGASYTWNFGDGSEPRTVAHSSGAIQHTYARPGNYTVTLRVINPDGSEENFSFRQTVTNPVTTSLPIHSSNIVGNATTVYAVNPDSGTVAAIDKASNRKIWEIAVGNNPQTLALDSKGRIWVAVQGDDKLVRIDARGTTARDFPMGYGSAPNGVVITRGDLGIATFSGKSQLITFNPNSGVESFKLNLPMADYRGIAVTGDSRYALVTRFRTNGEQAEVYKVDLQKISQRNAAKVIALPVDRVTVVSEAQAPGVPNYLHQVVIHPDGRKAYIPSKKDNIVDGVFRNGNRLKADSTVRSILSAIDIAGEKEVFEDQIDFNNRSPARAVTFFPLGNYAFVAQMESNNVEIVDPFSKGVVGVLPRSGDAPHGLYLDSARGRLYVNNFLSRDVAIHDVSRVLTGDSFVTTSPVIVSTVAQEPLAPEILAGKKIFYNAEDIRMANEQYMSCASCHVDGDSDGTVWDFTQRGEGLRRTISLQGRQGLGGPEGRLHWSANFDELQDFEKDIREEFGGAGFMSSNDYQETIDPLGAKKAGRSPELDNLAAYITSLSTFNKSPYRDTRGCLTQQAQVGKQIFDRLQCVTCHVSATVTDNKRHDVGTIQASSGLGSGQPLKDPGIDTPTLHGLWESTSFYHNGQARNLRDVFNQNRNDLELSYSTVHGGAVRASEIDPLVAYLNSLDGTDSCEMQ